MGKIPANQEQFVRNLYNAGNSAREIAEQMQVSIDAVYYFLRHHNIPRRSLAEDSRIRFARKPLSFVLKQNLSTNEKELKLAGLMLYWCEGYKTDLSCTVDFANSDSAMIQLFLRFLREICGITESRLRVYLYCYSNQDVASIIDYWSMVMNIPCAQFTKPYVRTDFKLDKIGKMPHGMVHVRYGDKKLLLLIKQWIKEYIKKNCVGTQAVNGGGL